jgi:hypothetical protein
MGYWSMRELYDSVIGDRGGGELGVGCCRPDMSEGEGRLEGGVGGSSGCGPNISEGEDRWGGGVVDCSEG